MNLSENLFNAYFDNRIPLEEFVQKVGLKENNYLTYLKKEIEKVSIEHNAERLENLIFSLFLWKDENDGHESSELAIFLDILNKLLIEKWHKQHENIVLLLQNISSIESLDYLYKAINLKPQYLLWDDNYVFEVKCVRAIYQIGKANSLKYLKILCKNDNDIISKMAQKQISKL